jgi:hypothetical protein
MALIVKIVVPLVVTMFVFLKADTDVLSAQVASIFRAEVCRLSILLSYESRLQGMWPLMATRGGKEIKPTGTVNRKMALYRATILFFGTWEKQNCDESQHVPSKRQYPLMALHGVTSQNQKTTINTVASL